MSIAGCVGDGDDTDVDVDPDERAIQSSFVTATSSEATDLHLYHIIDAHSALRVETLLDGAYALDMNDEFYPLWVRDIENIDDQEYVYSLYDNLEFGAGYGEMTSEDWVFHWEAVMRPAAIDGENWVNHGAPQDWAGVADLWAEDELTFHIELSEPDPLWIQTPAVWGEWIYPKGLVEPYYERYRDGDGEAGIDLAEDEDVLSFAYTGNLGPFTFEEREPEDRWVASRNEDYYRRGREPDAEIWAEAPYFEEMTIRVITETSTRLAELEVENLSGLGTTSPVPPDEVERTAGWDHINQYQIPSPFNYQTAYNQRANGWEPLRNREVRRAFSLAVDKELIANQIYAGAAAPGHTFQPEWSAFYLTEEVEQFGVGESYDIERARTILEDELDAYRYDGDDLVDLDGNQVELTLVHRASHVPEDDAGAYHQSQYEELGFAVDRVVEPTQVFIEEYVEQADGDGIARMNAGDRDEFVSNRDWDMLWSLGLNTFPRSPSLVTVFFGTDAPLNYFGWHEPDGTDIAQLVAETDPDMDAMQETLGEVFGIISREQPINFTIFIDDVAAYHSSVQVTEEEEAFGWGYLSPTWYKDRDIFV